MSIVEVRCASCSSPHAAESIPPHESNQFEQVPSMMASPTTVAASTNQGEQSDSLAISYLIRAYQVRGKRGRGVVFGVSRVAMYRGVRVFAHLPWCGCGWGGAIPGVMLKSQSRRPIGGFVLAHLPGCGCGCGCGRGGAIVL